MTALSPLLYNKTDSKVKAECCPFLIRYCFFAVIGGENNATVQSISNELKREGYRKVESEKDKIKVESSFVEYASEDYFIAYKIAKTLNIDSLIENNNLKNKIRVITK